MTATSGYNELDETDDYNLVPGAHSNQSSSPVEAVIRKRANQAMAAILDVKDTLDLDTNEDAKLRLVVLDEINELTNMCINLVKSTGMDQGFNLSILRKIEAIHAAVVRR